MNTDFKSLEKRYGTPLALKIQEEIARVDAKHFSFYQVPERLKSLRQQLLREGEDIPAVNPMAKVAWSKP